MATVFLPPAASSDLVPTTLTGEPQSVAIDDSGNVYVGDDGSISGPATNPARIIKLTVTGGTYTQSTIVSGLSGIGTLSLDGAGNLYYLINQSLYKATPVNGVYTSSLVGTGLALGIADGLGNIYYASGGTVGIPAGLYTMQLQSNGTYLSEGPLSIGAAILNQGSCGLERLDGIGIANGTFYFEGFDSCYNVYSGSSNASAVYGYTNGVNQPAVLISASTIPTVSYIYLPYPRTMAGTPYNSLYFWSFLGLNGGGSKIGDQLGDISGSVIPSAIAANAGGDLAITDAGSGINPYSSAGSGLYVMHRSTPPTDLLPPTGQGTISYPTGGYEVANLGNQPITISSLTFPTDFPEEIPNPGDCAANQVLATPTLVQYSIANSECNVTPEFLPTVSLGSATSNVLTEHATLTSASLSAPLFLPFSGTEVVATANPAFSPAPGTYSGNQTITITEATSGTRVWYRINGNVLNGATSYGSPFIITSTSTIEAYAVSPVSGNSQIVTVTYTLVPDFSLSATPASLTIGSGQSGSSTLTVASLSAFSSAVTFARGGLPTGASCSFSPVSVTPSSGSAATTTLTVNIPTTLGEVRPPASGNLARLASVISLFGLGSLTFRRRRRLLGLAALGLALLSVSACSSGSATPAVQKIPVNATITVTATSGSLQHTASISLYVP